MEESALDVYLRDQDKAAARDALDVAHHEHYNHLRATDDWLAGAQWLAHHLHVILHHPECSPALRGRNVHLRLVSFEELLAELLP